MFVKNTGQKCIGLGNVTILPEETKELPDGYGAKHPTVKFYLAKGWLISAETPAAAAAASKKADGAKQKTSASNKEKSADGQAG